MIREVNDLRCGSYKHKPITSVSTDRTVRYCSEQSVQCTLLSLNLVTKSLSMMMMLKSITHGPMCSIVINFGYCIAVAQWVAWMHAPILPGRSIALKGEVLPREGQAGSWWAHHCRGGAHMTRADHVHAMSRGPSTSAYGCSALGSVKQGQEGPRIHSR